MNCLFLSTPSARRATACSYSLYLITGFISIHALREEGDAIPWPAEDWKRLFLSTPSARRATGFFVDVLCYVCISIHALREEGDADAVQYKV